MSNHKPVKTISIGSAGFFCENCGRSATSTNTTLRVYKDGREVQIDHCGECKVTQETEFWRGPTTRVQNKETK